MLFFIIRNDTIASEIENLRKIVMEFRLKMNLLAIKNKKGLQVSRHFIRAFTEVIHESNG